MSPWFRLDNAVADRARELGTAAAMVAQQIGRLANGDGMAWPSMRYLMERTGLGETSVRRGIQRLAEAGLLEVQRRTGRTGVNTSNLYKLLFSPQDQGSTTDAIGCHDKGNDGTRDGTMILPPRTDKEDLSYQDSLTKTQEIKREKPASAGDIPVGLVELIDGWNSLGPNIVMVGNGADRDPPAKETLAGWHRAMKHPDQRAALQDIPALLTAILGAKFCHGQPWFTVPWIFGKNKNGELNICRLLAGDGTHWTVSGASVLRWIEREHIPVTISDEAKRIARRRMALRNPPAAPTKPATLVDDAVSLKQTWDAAEAQEENTATSEAWSTYLVILARYSEPQPEDAAELANLMHELGITPEQIKADLELIERTRELAAKHADLAAASQRAREAREAIVALEQKHRVEMEAAAKLKRQADNHHRDCHGAGYQLGLLARSRPQLFDMTAEPPTLRATQEAKG